MRREIAFPKAGVSAGAEREGAPASGHSIRTKQSFARKGIPKRSLGTRRELLAVLYSAGHSMVM